MPVWNADLDLNWFAPLSVHGLCLLWRNHQRNSEICGTAVIGGADLMSSHLRRQKDFGEPGKSFWITLNVSHKCLDFNAMSKTGGFPMELLLISFCKSGATFPRVGIRMKHLAQLQPFFLTDFLTQKIVTVGLLLIICFAIKKNNYRNTPLVKAQGAPSCSPAQLQQTSCL